MDPVTFDRRHDLSAFCTDDATYSVDCIRYDPTEKELQATNARVLMTVPLDCGDREFTLDSGQVHHFVKHYGEFEVVAVSDKVSKPATITVGGLTGPAITCRVNFPNIKNIKALVPEKPKATILLSAEYVRAIAEYSVQQYPDASLLFSITEPDDVGEIVVQRDGEKIATAIVKSVT